MVIKDVTWRLVYDKLRLRFNTEEFGFEDALGVIFDKKKFSSKDIKYGSKLLNEIEDNAYAIHTKASYDQRVRLYRLLNPEKVSDARGVYQVVHQKKKGFTSLAKEASRLKKWNYMYIRDSASGFYSDYYRSIDVHHLSIKEEELDGWIALFKLWDCQILVNNRIVHESISKAPAVHLHADLSSRWDQVAEMTNLHYQPPPYTIAECLEDNDVLGALAIMAKSRDTLMWNKVMEIARNNRVINTLGFCMEYINKEANKEVFSRRLLKKAEKLMEKRLETIGKTPELGTTVKTEHQDLEKKWNVKCYQVANLRKAVEDLIE